jgi:hypothetical protein
MKQFWPWLIQKAPMNLYNLELLNKIELNVTTHHLMELESLMALEF